MASIQDIKMYMKANNMTYQELSDRSQIPLNTLKNLFCGKTKNPRIDTMQAIERALGINEKAPPPNMTEGQNDLLKVYSSLTDENKDLLVKLISSFNDMSADKRRFVLDAIRLALGNQK